MRARAGLRLYAASTRARECTSARSLHSLAGSRKVVWTVKAALSFRASPVTAPGQLRNFQSGVFLLFLFQKLNLARLSPSFPATSNLRCLIFLASFSASEKKSHNLRRNVRSYYRIAHTLLRVIWLDTYNYCFNYYCAKQLFVLINFQLSFLSVSTNYVTRDKIRVENRRL